MIILEALSLKCATVGVCLPSMSLPHDIRDSLKKEMWK